MRWGRRTAIVGLVVALSGVAKWLLSPPKSPLGLPPLPSSAALYAQVQTPTPTNIVEVPSPFVSPPSIPAAPTPEATESEQPPSPAPTVESNGGPAAEERPRSRPASVSRPRRAPPAPAAARPAASRQPAPGTAKATPAPNVPTTAERRAGALSAVQQLMRARQASGSEARSVAGGSAPGAAAPPPASGGSVSGEQRHAAEVAFSTAGRDFMRALVEDAAGVASIVGAEKWRAVQTSARYGTVIQRIYDRVLTTEDKMRLLGAYRSANSAPASTPAALRNAPLPAEDLAAVRRSLQSARGREITDLLNR
jgi:hypothetical protein